MNLTGRFYDLDKGEDITDVALRNDGNEIAFDMTHSDRYRYTVVLKRHDGTLFKGIATSQPGGDVAELTCRVYEDPAEKITLIVGSDWRYPGGIQNCRWQVELQAD